MKKWPWFALSIWIILLDQVSKYWIQQHFNLYDSVNLFPFLNITLAYNTGAAFSFLSSTGSWHTIFFMTMSLFVSLLLIYWILTLPPRDRTQLTGMALILGGALGNVIDRLWNGHVIDFIQLYYKSFYWPVFNIADSAICIGGFLLLLDMFRGKKKVDQFN
jgi:signal peptidase II